MRKLLAAVLTVAALAACGVHTNRAVESDGPELIRQATEFGRLVLPPSARVLMAHMDHGIDTRYQLAIQIDPDDLARMLIDSRFGNPLTKAAPPFDKTIAGPDLASSPSVVAAQDRIRNDAGTSVYRDFVVDQRSPAAWFVHVSAFTT